MAVITKEQVFAAADALAEAGEKITQQKIRDAVGGGSFSTIGPLLSEWEAARAEVNAARAVVMPDGVKAVLDDAAARLWKAATDSASLGVEAARKEVDALKAKVAHDVQEARDAVAIVEGERDEMGAEVSRLRDALAEAEAVARREVDARHGAETARAVAEARAEAADKAAAVADARAAAAEERAERANARVAAAVKK